MPVKSGFKIHVQRHFSKNENRIVVLFISTRQKDAYAGEILAARHLFPH